MYKITVFVNKILMTDVFRVILNGADMGYISFEYFLFLIIFLIGYFVIPKKTRPLLTLLASLVFYAFSGWQNLIFLIAQIVITFIFGLLIEEYDKHKKILLTIPIVLIAGYWLISKFTNYLIGLAAGTGAIEPLTIEFLIPLGMSFFSLQAIAYLVDVYRGKYSAEKNPLKIALYLSYFPLVVQGPISRYDQLGETLFIGHEFDYTGIKYGLQLFVWGIGKKLLVANYLNVYVSKVFDNYTEYSGIVIIFASIAFAIELYADFSAVTDMSIGISQVIGVDLIDNFNRPYSAVSIKDFWSRWHISLTSWLREYIYFPLGGSRKGLARKYFNQIVVFFVSGIWHGVGINYIVWGMYNAIAQILGEITAPFKRNIENKLEVRTDVWSYRFGRQFITFGLVTYGWLLFRAPGLKAAIHMTRSIFTNFLGMGQVWSVYNSDKSVLVVAVINVCIFFIIDNLKAKMNIRATLDKQSIWFRWGVYFIVIFYILIFGMYGAGYDASQFIYMGF